MFTTIVLRIGAFAGSLSISLTEMALAILIFLAVYRVYRTKDYSIFKKNFFIFFILMIIAETISTFAGVDPERSIKDFFSWWVLLYLPALYILFEGKDKLTYLFYVFAGAVIASLYGIYQAAFFTTETGRASGFFSHALTYGNVLAMVCIAALSVLAFCKFQKRNGFYITLGTLLICIPGLLVSASRGPILYFILTALILMVYRFKWRGLAAGALAVMIIVIAVTQVSFIKSRFEMLSKNIHVTDSSIGSRLVLWDAASEAIMMRPIFGYGKRNFKSEVSKYITVKTSSRAHAHNSYIQYTFLHGFFGLFAMLGFFSSIMLEIMRRMHSGPFVKTAFFILVVFLLEGLTENNFTDSEVAMMFCSLVGLMLAPGRASIAIDEADEEFTEY